MKRRLAVSFTTIAISLAATAHAQGTDVDRAKTFFNAGARAYDAGDFPTAIEAFEAAEKLAPRPAILFSVAQAHRRQYFLDGKADQLRTAIQDYRAYVDATPAGQGRRADAAQALTDLVPIAVKLAPDTGAKVADVRHTKINVSSPTPGAQVSCDKSQTTSPGTPLTLEVSPGRHMCKVTAAGFSDVIREVDAVDGEFVPVEVSLTEQPAQLSIVGATGAEVSVDGRTIGAASGVVFKIAPGVHLIAVSRNGHDAFVREVEFSRGQTKRIDVDLKSSGQRKVATGALMLGGASILAGGIFTVVALVEEGRAKSVLDKQGTQNIGVADLSTYNDAHDARTTWTDAAILGFGAGTAIAAAGLLLYVFDAPNTTNSSAPADTAPNPRTTPSQRNELREVGASPMVAPGFLGASFTARF